MWTAETCSSTEWKPNNHDLYSCVFRTVKKSNPWLKRIYSGTMSLKVIFYPVTDTRRCNSIFSNLSRPSTLDARILPLLRFQMWCLLERFPAHLKTPKRKLNYYHQRERKERWFYKLYFLCNICTLFTNERCHVWAKTQKRRVYVMCR